MSSHMRDPAEDVQHQQVTQSTILLLLQEATNLAPPADDGSSRGENPDRGALILSGPQDSELTGSFSAMRESDRSSAWEVMHLINQQCERLLRSGGPTDLDCAETVMLPAVSSGDACFSVAVVYSSESVTDVEEVKESDDLAELIKTSMSEKCLTENTPVESKDEGCSDERGSVLSTGNDFDSCLVSEQDALNASENASQPADLNNNLIESPNTEIQDARREPGRTQRKQPRPARSPDPQDPDVRGVTFSMHPHVEGDTYQSRLIITSNYSEIRRLRRSRSSRCRSLHSSRCRSLHTCQRSSCSEDERDACGLSRSKMCASCCTRKTPLWRDAEDGTPLCNACGIRYKKYRVRCQQCWNIPKKDANTNSKCQKCGDVLKLKCSGW